MNGPDRILTIILIILTSLAVTACGKQQIPGPAAVLLFNGTGTSPDDDSAVEAILQSKGIDYSTANSSQLIEMDEQRIRSYRLLIVPGGNFVRIGNGLTANTTARIRDAVESGVNYLGICAGAFFAGNSPYNGLNLTSGVKFGFYSAESQGVRKTVVAIAGPGSSKLDQYWEDGPQLSGWGAVVARYPDGMPAVAEGSFGAGWVVLTGIHAEAPAEWRRGMTFGTPISVDTAYAATLIDAALTRTALAHD